jgi:hypothetical protein
MITQLWGGLPTAPQMKGERVGGSGDRPQLEVVEGLEEKLCGPEAV